MEQKSNSLATQVGGSHYKDMKIQPVEFIHANNIPFIEGACIKYLCRHRNKGRAEDLRKVIHFCEMLIEMEYGEEERQFELEVNEIGEIKMDENGNYDKHYPKYSPTSEELPEGRFISQSANDILGIQGGYINATLNEEELSKIADCISSDKVYLHKKRTQMPPTT